MTKEQLQEALDRYGGNLERWPDQIRLEAETLAATDVAAARTLSAAQSVERGLGAAAKPMTVDSALLGRIIAGIDHAPAHELALRPTRRLVAWAGAAMVAFLITGFAAGLAIPQSQSDDSLASLMFGGSAYGADDASGSLL